MPILTMTASLQSEETGLEYQQPAAGVSPEVPRPEALRSLEEHMAPRRQRSPPPTCCICLDACDSRQRAPPLRHSRTAPYTRHERVSRVEGGGRPCVVPGYQCAVATVSVSCEHVCCILVIWVPTVLDLHVKCNLKYEIFEISAEIELLTLSNYVGN